jgi:hypothetical protein
MEQPKIKTVGLDAVDLTSFEIVISLEPDLEIRIKSKDPETLLTIAARCMAELKGRGYNPKVEVLP